MDVTLQPSSLASDLARRWHEPTIIIEVVYGKLTIQILMNMRGAIERFNWRWLCLAAAIAVALFIGLSRITWEAGSHQVTLAIDITSIIERSALSEPQLRQLLTKISEEAMGVIALSPKMLRYLSPSIMHQLDVTGVVWIFNFYADPEELAQLLDQAAQIKSAGVLLRYPTLGDQEQLRIILKKIGHNNLFLAFDEFQSASALRALYEDHAASIARAHILSEEERQKLSEAESAQRIGRAVKERGIRLVLLPVDESGRITADLKATLSELESNGFQIGTEITRQPFQPEGWAFSLLLGLILLSMTGQALKFCSGKEQRSLLILIVSALLLAIGIIFASPEMQLLLAWLIAASAPVASYLFLKKHLQHLDGPRASLLWLGGLSLGSLAGGLVAAAFLSESLFLLGIESVRGIKLALITPIAIVAFIELRQRDLRSLTAWEIAVGIGLISILAIMLLRTDNLSLLPASGEELDARGFLESLLYARPRFKEFLLGHPALWIWGALTLTTRQRGWTLALLLAGLIGQVSIINSFLHMHTPLWITLVRILNGLLLGALFGLIGYSIIKLAHRFWISQRLNFTRR